MPLLRTIFLSQRQHGVIAALVSASAVLSMLIAFFGPPTLDEGIFVYDMGRASEGAVPMRDFYSLSPVHAWLGALFVKLFGMSMFSGRLLSVALHVFGMLSVFGTAKELYGNRTALIAAIVFGFGPTILILGGSAAYQPAAFNIASFAVLTMVMGISRQRIWFILLSGLILGFDVWVYRGVMPLAMGLPFLVLYLQRSNFARASAFFGVFLAGMSLSFGLILAYLASVSSLEHINQIWGLGGGRGSGSITDFASGQAPQWSVFNRLSSMENLTSYVNFHSRVLYVMTRDWLYLFVPAFLFITSIVLRINRKQKTAWIILLLAAVLYVFLVARGQVMSPRGDYGTFALPAQLEAASALAFALTLAIGLTLIGGATAEQKRTGLGDSIVMGWALLVVAFLLVNSVTHAFYAIALAPVFSVMTGALLDRLLPTSMSEATGASGPSASLGRFAKNRAWIGLPAAFASSLVLALAVTGIGFTSAVAFGWATEYRVPTSTIRNISTYLQRNTSERDLVFATFMPIVVAADRQTPLDVSNLWPYVHGYQLPANVDRFNSLPSPQDIVRVFKDGRVKYVARGQQGDLLAEPLYSLTFSEIWSIVEAYYVKESTIGGFDIYRLSQ